MHKRVVLFKDSGGVRIYKNPRNLEELKKQGKVLINPSIPMGIAPEFWKLKNGKISTNRNTSDASPRYGEPESDFPLLMAVLFGNLFFIWTVLFYMNMPQIMGAFYQSSFGKWLISLF